MDLEKYLKSRFGLPGFRPGQKDIISTVLSGRDCIAIMATGGGKTLCYQFPGSVLDGITLVITPIISLMADQAKRLMELDLPAGYLSSAKSREEQQNDLVRLKQGKLKFILVSPERLKSAAFIEAVKYQHIGFIAVDEAHCISQWGHDFRPEYLQIGDFRRMMGEPPCLALTGTATARVESEIAQFLNMHEPLTFKSTFNRPNLRYLVYREKEVIDKLDRLRKLLSQLKGCGIIYCGTRKEVEFIAITLESWHISCLPYHAGLPAEERSCNQNAWINGEVGLISATNAFGMGIDKPDVRFVIHFSMSSSMENYYQEAGRAGRDGEASLCIVMHSDEDSRKIRVIRKMHELNTLISIEHRTHLQEMADSCVLYTESTACRRRLILNYFQEEYEFTNCGSCDHCMGELRLYDQLQLRLPDAKQSRLQRQLIQSIKEKIFLLQRFRLKDLIREFELLPELKEITGSDIFRSNMQFIIGHFMLTGHIRRNLFHYQHTGDDRMPAMPHLAFMPPLREITERIFHNRSYSIDEGRALHIDIEDSQEKNRGIFDSLLYLHRLFEVNRIEKEDIAAFLRRE